MKESPESLGDVMIWRSTKVFGLMLADEGECTPRVVCSLSLVDAYSVFIIYTIKCYRVRNFRVSFIHRERKKKRVMRYTGERVSLQQYDMFVFSCTTTLSTHTAF